MNKQTIAIAEKNKIERLHEIQNETYGFKNPTKTLQESI